MSENVDNRIPEGARNDDISNLEAKELSVNNI